MQPRTAYLAWVRTAHPDVYWAAMKSVFTPGRAALGGLGDDLTATITPDLTSSADLTTDANVDIPSDATDAVNAAYNATVASPSSSSSSDLFSSITNAISSIGQSVVQTQAQQNLLAINTARAKQGLPPLTANGVPVTASGLVPTSATLAQIEASMGGAGGMSLIVLGGLGLLAVALLSGRKSS